MASILAARAARAGTGDGDATGTRHLSDLRFDREAGTARGDRSTGTRAHVLTVSHGCTSLLPGRAGIRR
ncbi:hypothetical protein AQJ66_00650 [Streptomyces bungoensis]|uniref:Uncharacterized protein n=1 Tax=Streptomyces bungoensis TaxID=285568 RepID=A0A117RH32_9ACTN|nr:hypothetical protein AQJ66_00650 [Streptomyces bungoensis]